MTDTVRVKFFAKGIRQDVVAIWSRQLPGSEGRWGNVQFLFDLDARDYDWLVVYDDLPPVGAERFSSWVEELACPRERTIFVTAEPSTIKIYSAGFLSQFGWVITSQEPWAVARHPRVIHRLPGLRWFYGAPSGWEEHPERLLSWDQIAKAQPFDKQHDLATVTSSKAMAVTEHAARIEFVRRLNQDLPQFELFGRGIRPISDKSEALDGYRYHLAIENHICDHHITEKLTDAFLGGCLPFYFGAPNTAEYFPADSFIPIDIHDYPAALALIEEAIRNNAYERHIDAIREARRLVLEKYNLFAILASLIDETSPSLEDATRGGQVMGRHLYRRRHPLSLFSELLAKTRARRRYARERLA